MHHSAGRCRDELTEILAIQQQVYDQANALLGPLPEMITKESDLTVILGQLDELMAMAARNEIVLREKWSEWQSHGTEAPASLHTAWQEAELSLRELITKVDTITAITQASRDALMPSMQATATQRQMRIAYGH
ncbi:MAG: hypothetical protein KDA60_21785 [Planctomycetales bacterium]|nr:hypothetical protein [Planctomycetales bacterium]